MKEPGPLPFLARPGYRRRRLIEAIRLLPYVGLLFFLLPILWARGEDGKVVLTSHAAVYLFAAWFVLILATILTSSRLAREEASDLAESEN